MLLFASLTRNYNTAKCYAILCARKTNQNNKNIVSQITFCFSAILYSRIRVRYKLQLLFICASSGVFFLVQQHALFKFLQRNIFTSRKDPKALLPRRAIFTSISPPKKKKKNRKHCRELLKIHEYQIKQVLKNTCVRAYRCPYIQLYLRKTKINIRIQRAGYFQSMRKIIFACARLKKKCVGIYVCVQTASYTVQVRTRRLGGIRCDGKGLTFYVHFQ